MGLFMGLLKLIQQDKNGIASGWINFLFFALTVVSGPSVIVSKVFAAEEWQKGQVILDGAMVYEQSDFDSKVLAYLPAGRFFSISSRTYGPFYKIEFDKGSVGWISDVDIKPSKSSGGRNVANDGAAKKGGKSAPEDNTEVPEVRQRFEDAKYIGGGLLSAKFAEKTLGDVFEENMLFYGVKLSGPGVLLPGGEMDFNILYHSGAPKPYAKYSGWQTKGMIILLDALFIQQTSLGRNLLVYYGLGPLLHINKYEVYIKNALTDAKEFIDINDVRIGTAFAVGIGFRLKSLALKFEGKYNYDRAPYSGLGFAMQFEL